jgi:hypothetical protein
MSQIYMQRFEYRGAVTKSEFDAAWGAAHEVMASTGNWGGVEKGITHLHGYGTSWGGYAVIEVEDPQALVEYQLFHVMNYSHMVKITFDPLVDLDEALAPMYAEIRATGDRDRLGP